MSKRLAWVILAALLAPTTITATGPLPFIEDDYGRSIEQARSRRLPLLVEAWAPWCHTCRYMRANVFTDPALAKHAVRFVWLSVDTEKPKNSAFLQKFPVQAWPTLLVIDGASEQVLLRWYGTATVPQLVTLLEDGERAFRARATDGSSAEGALARADRLNGERKWSEAAKEYRRALQAGGASWPRRERALESLMVAMQFAREREDCAATAIAEAPTLSRQTTFAKVVTTGLICAVGAPAGAVWRSAAFMGLSPLAEEALRVNGLLGDDRSELYDRVVSLAESQKDATRVKQLAREWFEFLEAERKRGETAEARAASDGHRVTAALKMGAPERAVPALKASEAELPLDYNPPARLAVIYREMGRFDDALAASDRALVKAYGPRKILILTQRAQIYEKKGDHPAARRTIEQALKLAEATPDRAETVDSLRKWHARLN